MTTERAGSHPRPCPSASCSRTCPCRRHFHTAQTLGQMTQPSVNGSLLTRAGARLTDAVEDERDPLAVLQWTAEYDAGLVARVDDELRRAELAAVATASPTPYARDVIIAACHVGRPVAIVSNNSEPAIRAYLDSQDLARYVGCVVGRPYADPGQMKPSPDLILHAVALVDAESKRCVLVGDSVTDVEGGRLAGVWTIGYANKTGKAEALTRARADAIMIGSDGMEELALALATEIHPLCVDKG